MTPSNTDSRKDTASHQGLPVWHRRWFQHMLVALVVILLAVLIIPPLAALAYAVRSVLVPALIGLGLAYAVNPLAGWLEQRMRVPRPVSAAAMMAGVVLAVAGFSVYIVPRLYAQLSELISRLPVYLEQLGEAFEVDVTQVRKRVEEAVLNMMGTDAADEAGAVDVGVLAGELWGWLDVGIGVIGATVGLVGYLVIAAVIVAFCFFFFLWRFERLAAWFVPLIPVSRRERVLAIAGSMNRTVSAFIRGRIVQAIIVAVVLSVGWWFLGVPYWLLLGLLGGLFNLVPYLVVVVWPMAMLLAWLNLMSGGAVNGEEAVYFDIWQIIIWPTVVYLVAQALDNWVVEPAVQGQATGMDPLAVLLAVLLGVALAGLLGMLIAIPLAACIKILCQEALLPWLRAWARES